MNFFWFKYFIRKLELSHHFTFILNSLIKMLTVIRILQVYESICVLKNNYSMILSITACFNHLKTTPSCASDITQASSLASLFLLKKLFSDENFLCQHFNRIRTSWPFRDTFIEFEYFLIKSWKKVWIRTYLAKPIFVIRFMSLISLDFFYFIYAVYVLQISLFYIVFCFF